MLKSNDAVKSADQRLKDDVVRILHANAVDCPSCKRVMPSHTFYCSNCGSPLTVEHRSFVRQLWIAGMTSAGIVSLVIVISSLLCTLYLSQQVRADQLNDETQLISLIKLQNKQP